VVDDDEGAREIAKFLLERAGFTVRTAVDGFEAIEIFRQDAGSFRCVVLDNTMPGLSGAEVLDAIREVDPAMPVVVVSGYTRAHVADELLARGGVRFLPKPFDRSALLAAIWELLDPQAPAEP
jgi:CheY-like chemotaxis protein